MAVVPSTHLGDSIPSDLPLGGRSRYGDRSARSRTEAAPVGRETLPLRLTGPNLDRRLFALIGVTSNTRQPGPGESAGRTPAVQRGQDASSLEPAGGNPQVSTSRCRLRLPFWIST
jgi:hypothetical protein